MSFVMRDETAGINILYVDNNNNMGLGSLPVAGHGLTVQGQGALTEAALFAAGFLVPGSQLAYEGSIFIPNGGSANVAVATAQSPTVTATIPPSASTPTAVTFSNNLGFNVTTNYAIW